MLDQAIHALAYAWGGPVTSGCLRRFPEDFQVSEIPLLAPDGQGEHVWLRIRKRQQNTAWVADRLAKLAGISGRQVSYAGLKDRQAVTEQWFSVHLPGQPMPDWTALNDPAVEVISVARHSRKLRRGALQGNEFKIHVREVQGDRQALEQQLAMVSKQGVPNYFGLQRFGSGGSNLQTAAALFRSPQTRLSRQRRSLALSAARSLLFNQVLSRRVADGTWNRAIDGDALQLQGSHSYFVAAAVDAGLMQRIAAQDVHPTGPLPGSGENPVLGECRQLEDAVLDGYREWQDGLAALRVKQDRRALRLVVGNLQWDWPAADELLLTFTLPAGGYATSVLRELITSNPDEAER
ncbi:MAG: tRNA pseudouridine(13) synthase TruD [Gammaproteobacteria bacterium]